MSGRKRGRICRLHDELEKHKYFHSGARDVGHGHDHIESETCRRLLWKWVWGLMSAAEVAHHAAGTYHDIRIALRAAGVADSVIDPVLVTLANLGTHPTRALRLFFSHITFPEPMMVQVHMKVHKHKRKLLAAIMQVEVPLMLPHLVFHHVFTTSQKHFSRVFGSGEKQLPDELEDFWNEVCRRKDPRLRYHPMVRQPFWKRRAIPLKLYGDGVPVIRCARAGVASLDAYTWSGVLTKEVFSPLSRFLMFAVFGT